MTGTPQLFPFPSKMLLWSRKALSHIRSIAMGCASLYPSYPKGPDLPGLLHQQEYLLASEIRAWSAGVSEPMTSGISSSIAPRIFPIIAK